MRRLVPVLLAFVIASSCQQNPPLMITPYQQASLDEVTAEVTREAQAMRSENLTVTADTVRRLLRNRDVRVRALLDDDQWQLYEEVHRERLARVIYQDEFRPQLGWRQTVGTEVNTLPVPTGEVSSN